MIALSNSPLFTVLLVDDDDAVRTLLSAWLGRAGHKVLAAANGPDALDLLRQAPNSISLVISDVEIPYMSGIELAALITQMVVGCPVLLISGEPLPRQGAIAD